MARKPRLIQHPIVMRFATELRSARKRHGLSQQDLALTLHTTPAYVGRLERGESAPGIDTLARIADALSMKPAELLGESKVSQSSHAQTRRLLQRRVKSLVGRDQEHAERALAIVVGLMDDGLARQSRG